MATKTETKKGLKVGSKTQQKKAPKYVAREGKYKDNALIEIHDGEALAANSDRSLIVSFGLRKAKAVAACAEAIADFVATQSKKASSTKD